MIVQKMSEEKSHIGNVDSRSVGMSYRPEHPSRLHHG